MKFSTKAKAMMAAGLSVSCLFLVLGIRELSHPARPAAAAVPATPARPAPPPMLVPLATATRAIAVGETISATLVTTRGGNPKQNGLIATPAEVIGKVATQPIAAGAPILRTMIDTDTKLAIRVPVGMRAMSIDTTAEIAVAGLVRPGDRVDVQVIYPGEDTVTGMRGTGRSRAETLLQMVPVLAVGGIVLGERSGASSTDPQAAAASSPARTVTLALTPEQVSTLSLAKNVGALYLSLRNPKDQALTDAHAVGPAPAPRPAAYAVATGTPAASAAPRPARRAAAASGGGHEIKLVIGGRSEIIQSGSGK